MISGASAKYPTMTFAELAVLPIRDIAARDCVIFLWATTPLLPDAISLLREWGFTYKTAIYWRKIMSLGMGFWFRGQVEVCLMGTKGNIKAFRCQRPNFIQSKVRQHSQKPDEFFTLIDDCTPRPRIELFARDKREGWDAMGYAIDGRSIQETLSDSRINQ